MLQIIYTVLQCLAAVAATAAAAVSIRTRILARLANANAKAAAASSGETSRTVDASLADARQGMVELLTAVDLATTTIGQMIRRQDEMAVRHDDLFAAYLRQETLNNRVRLVERYLADHETRLRDDRAPHAAPEIIDPPPAPTPLGTFI